MGNRFLAVVLFMLSMTGCGQNRSSLTDNSMDQIISSDSSINVNNAPFEDLKGNPILLSDYKGKRVLLHFWATWCKPCIEELPGLERVRPMLEKENYQLLLVSEESLDELKAYQEKSGFGIEFLRYEGALSELKIYALPATLIFNEKGEKVKEISGRMDWDSEVTNNQLINLP